MTAQVKKQLSRINATVINLLRMKSWGIQSKGKNLTDLCKASPGLSGSALDGVNKSLLFLKAWYREIQLQSGNSKAMSTTELISFARLQLASLYLQCFVSGSQISHPWLTES